MATYTRQADHDLFLADDFPASNFNGFGLRTGVAAGPKVRRTLLHFDLSDFPEYLSIDAATVALQINIDGILDVAAKVYRITQSAWSEGAATWNKYNALVNWATPGGDYDGSTPTPVQFFQPRNPGVLTLSPLRAFVVDAIDNRSSQLHLLLRQDDEATAFGEYTYYDHETDPNGDQPLLTVTYTRPSSETLIDDPRATIGAAAPAQPARASSPASAARAAPPARS